MKKAKYIRPDYTSSLYQIYEAICGPQGKHKHLLMDRFDPALYTEPLGHRNWRL